VIEKLEKIRRDPQLNNYVVAKTKQIEKNLEELSRTESMENEKRKEEIRKYGDSFSRTFSQIQKQLYIEFSQSQNMWRFFLELEKEFNEYKERLKQKGLQLGAQGQMTNQSPYQPMQNQNQPVPSMMSKQQNPQTIHYNQQMTNQMNQHMNQPITQDFSRSYNPPVNPQNMTSNYYNHHGMQSQSPHGNYMPSSMQGNMQAGMQGNMQGSSMSQNPNIQTKSAYPQPHHMGGHGMQQHVSSQSMGHSMQGQNVNHSGSPAIHGMAPGKMVSHTQNPDYSMGRSMQPHLQAMHPSHNVPTPNINQAPHYSQMPTQQQSHSTTHSTQMTSGTTQAQAYPNPIQRNAPNNTPIKNAPALLPNQPTPSTAMNKPMQNSQTTRMLIENPSQQQIARPKNVEKEKFLFNFNFDSEIYDPEKKKEILTEVYKKIKNPYGDIQVIERFKKEVEMQLESQANRQKKLMNTEDLLDKRIKINPNGQRETNMMDSYIQRETPSVTSFYSQELQEVKKDDRFKVEEKIPMGGNVQSIEATIYKSGGSLHDKIVVRINRNGPAKIEILETIQIENFLDTYRSELNEAITHGKLKVILHLWLDFLDQLERKSMDKLVALDEIFN